jgi:hypothetical protein
LGYSCHWYSAEKKGYSGVGIISKEVPNAVVYGCGHDLFDADFHESSDFWLKVRKAYENWWSKYYQAVPASHRPKNTKMSKNWNSGGTFLWHQLNKTWGGRLPELSSTTPFIPAKKDLY